MSGTSPASPDYSILSSLQRPPKLPRVSFLYQLGLLLVAFTMLLLPLIYLVLVGGAAYGVYYHAVHHWKPIMSMADGHVSFVLLMMKGLAYFGPLFVGGVIVFFLFKPVFAGQPKRAQPLALNPAHEPLLYALIEKICDCVGAPSPRRIDLDCQVNASAGFRRGIWGMSSRDMVLTIGLPLVASLNVREFAGVIAHEFGHFTQGTAMRLHLIVSTINVWFLRVAYERDAWDVALEEWSAEAENLWVALVIWITQIGVWFSRLILRVLMYIGFFISGFMSRQMEYNADAHQIAIVGSETFETTLRKLATLAAAQELASRQIYSTWKKSGRLPDNLAEVMRRAHEQLPPKVHQQINDTLGLQRTGFFATHPSPADRIRQARRAAEPGLFSDDRPATALFTSFDHPARFVTLLHYTDDLGIPIRPEMLLHVETSPSATTIAAANDANVADQYFFNLLPLVQPILIGPVVASRNFEADAAELEQLTNGLRNVADQLASIATQYREASKKLLNARAALRLLEAGHRIQPVDFDLPEATQVAARANEEEAVATRESLRHSVREVAGALQRRLQLALALRLAGGEYEDGNIPLEELEQLIQRNDRRADEFEAQQEGIRAVMILERVGQAGEPGTDFVTLNRALAAQAEVVASSRAKETAPVSETRPGAGLRLAKRQPLVSESDVEAVRQQTLQWYSEYQADLEALVRIAQAVEGVSG